MGTLAKMYMLSKYTMVATKLQNKNLENQHLIIDQIKPIYHPKTIN